jgi:acyl-CoA thioester hydrolase
VLGTRDGRPSYTHTIRVAYVDTDAAGVVHHSQYFRYLEQGRVELMRAVGVDYRTFEIARGLALPVVEARLKYRAPARFDELLALETWLAEGSRAKLVFASALRRVADDVLLHDASVTLACVTMPSGAICSVPADLREKLGA